MAKPAGSVRTNGSYAKVQDGVTRRTPNGGVTDTGPVGTAVGAETPLNSSLAMKTVNVYTPPGSPTIHAFQHEVPLGARASGVVRAANVLQARETGVGTGKYTLVNNFMVNHPNGGKTGAGNKVFGRNLSLAAAKRKARSILEGGRAGVDENGQIFTSDKPVRSRG